MSFDICTALRKARQAKGLTQKQLAQQLNEKPALINDYESGRAIPDNALIAKIERMLGSKLPRQAKKKSCQGGVSTLGKPAAEVAI